MDKTIIITILCLLIPLGLSTGCNRGAAYFGEPVRAAEGAGRPEPVTEPEGIRFLSDHAGALETARREAKPTLVFFSLPNCPSSKRMRETTFQDAEIKRLSGKFVCVSVDALAQPGLCESYGVKAFPTLLILSAQGSELNRLSGKQMTEQLSLQMHVALQSTATKPVSRR